MPYHAAVALPSRSRRTSAGRTHFLCRSCGAAHPKWLGKCPDCGTWDSLEKFTEVPDGTEHAAAAWLPPDADPEAGLPASTAQPLSEVAVDDVPRVATGIGELDRVLGGGLVRGSVVLLGGEPGIGKSTLLLQALASMASGSSDAAHDSGRPILYVSSEESARQVRLRADRLEVGTERGGDAAPPASVGGGPERTPADARGRTAQERLFVLAETSLARIGEQIRTLRPAVCAIDSIQMIHRPDVDAAAGSITQVRRCCADLLYLAKRSGMPIIVVGHVTKDGQLAGPKLLEHLVDVVLSFEGDRHHGHRIVRGIKNRFGSTQEIGLFEMTGGGLRELAEGLGGPDPDRPPAVGTAACPTILGTRCLLAEIEALTATGVLGNARRKASGLDSSRLAMLIAVLEKHGGLRLADQDVFVSAAGGLRVTEPAADLATALAIAGAHYRRSMPPASVAIGEVGLTGRVRPVPQMTVRVREALRRGFRSLIVPAAAVEEAAVLCPKDALMGVADVGAALAQLWEPPAAPSKGARDGARGGRGGAGGGEGVGGVMVAARRRSSDAESLAEGAREATRRQQSSV